jgi:hypothetical protein
MKLQLDTEELRTASNRLKTEAGELEQAIADMESAVSPCREHISPRIQAAVEAWDAMKAQFKAKVEELGAAAQEYLATAVDNEGANTA